MTQDLASWFGICGPSHASVHQTLTVEQEVVLVGVAIGTSAQGLDVFLLLLLVLVGHPSLKWIGHPSPTWENFKLLVEFIVSLIDCF